MTSNISMGRATITVDGVPFTVGVDPSAPGAEVTAGVNEQGEVVMLEHDVITGEARWRGPDRHGVLGGCLKAASSPARLAEYVVARSWPCGCPMTPEEEADSLAQVMRATESLVERPKWRHVRDGRARPSHYKRRY